MVLRVAGILVVATLGLSFASARGHRHQVPAPPSPAEMSAPAAEGPVSLAPPPSSPEVVSETPVPPPLTGAPASPAAEAAEATPAQRHSPFRQLSPLDEVDLAVALTPSQRETVRALVDEREALMHAIYSEAVAEGRNLSVAADDVTRVYLSFDERIRRELGVEQQIRYDEGRRERRIGAPMFVFRYGE